LTSKLQTPSPRLTLGVSFCDDHCDVSNQQVVAMNNQRRFQPPVGKEKRYSRGLGVDLVIVSQRSKQFRRAGSI